MRRSLADEVLDGLDDGGAVDAEEGQQVLWLATARDSVDSQVLNHHVPLHPQLTRQRLTDATYVEWRGACGVAWSGMEWYGAVWRGEVWWILL